jgi:hypothetical protein
MVEQNDRCGQDGFWRRAAQMLSCFAQTKRSTDHELDDARLRITIGQPHAVF